MATSSLDLTVSILVAMLTVYCLPTCCFCSAATLVISGLGLTEVPSCLQGNAIELDLSNNSITTLNRDDLGKLRSLKTTDLSYNEI